MQSKKVAIIGAGPAGLGAASVLTQQGVKVSVYHRETQVGGHMTEWAYLFPGFEKSSGVAQGLMAVMDHKKVGFESGCNVTRVVKNESNGFDIEVDNGRIDHADAVVYAGGFDVFDASRKEELGYGIYPRVVTSVDIESMLKGEKPFPFQNQEKMNIGIVHCVGSRDEKSGNRHCSRMCCVTGVKQAIELKKRFPASQITSFYMDMRMFGNGYEELYLDAQRNHSVLFVRGRVSEVAEDNNGLLKVKAEDTLLGRPLRGTFDLLVLLVGMEAPKVNCLPEMQAVQREDGFLSAENVFIQAHQTGVEGLYLAGTCKGPQSIPEALADGKAAGQEVLKQLLNN